MKRRIEKVIAKIEIVTDNPACGSVSDHRERLHSDYPKHLIATAIENVLTNAKCNVEIEYADCWDVEGEAQ